MPTGLQLITALQESQNRDYYPNGSPVRSPAGALYAMQVMPSTAANPGFGIKPAQTNTPAEYNRVGADYLNVMNARYGGDMSKMWAAYNWGPGNVDSAIKKWGPYWLSHAPKETQQYVSQNLAAKDSQVATSPIDLIRRAQAFNVDIPPADMPQQGGPVPAQGFDLQKAIMDSLAQPSAQPEKKKGSVWGAVLGAISDGLLAMGGDQPIYAPAMLKRQELESDQNLAQQRLSAEIKNQKLSLLQKLMEPPQFVQNMQAWQQLSPQQKHDYLTYQDATNPINVATPQGTTNVPRTSTKVINGKTYYNVGGEWYEEDQ